MTMRLQALIFDVDGTLADTEEAHRVAFNHVFERHRLGWQWSRSDYRALLHVTGGKERVVAHLQALPLRTAERHRLLALVPELHAEKNRCYISLVRDGGVPLRPGVARLLDEAEHAGLRLAIATTSSEENVDALLHATLGPRGVQRFAARACGDQVARKKPAPDVYQLALRRLALAPEQAVAFEDSQHGLHAAAAAGLWTVVTPTPWTEGQDFRAAGLVLPHLGAPDQPWPVGFSESAWLSVADLQRLGMCRPPAPQHHVVALQR